VQISERQTSNGGIVATYADITELKQREAEPPDILRGVEDSHDARTAQTARNGFLNMSHELRTPLNAIINVTEMLMEDARLKRPDDVGPPRAPRRPPLAYADRRRILDLSRSRRGVWSFIFLNRSRWLP
jgi:signal transduction histidine kinase